MWIPKMIAIVLVYISIVGLLGLLTYLIAPIFIIEIKEFSNYLPDYFNKINPVLQQLGIDFAAVNVKTKTNEGLGEIGAGQAMAATAIALLKKKRRRTL